MNGPLSSAQLASVMDTARASIVMCANSVKISPQESSVKTACQVIMEIQPMEGSVQGGSIT
ncbi:Importin-9 [Manis pentadactyla]|nr:Importin-9 [Manis pentadactyla]